MDRGFCVNAQRVEMRCTLNMSFTQKGTQLPSTYQPHCVQAISEKNIQAAAQFARSMPHRFPHTYLLTCVIDGDLTGSYIETGYHNPYGAFWCIISVTNCHCFLRATDNSMEPRAATSLSLLSAKSLLPIRTVARQGSRPSSLSFDTCDMQGKH